VLVLFRGMNKSVAWGSEEGEAAIFSFNSEMDGSALAYTA